MKASFGTFSDGAFVLIVNNLYILLFQYCINTMPMIKL